MLLSVKLLWHWYVKFKECTESIQLNKNLVLKRYSKFVIFFCLNSLHNILKRIPHRMIFRSLYNISGPVSIYLLKKKCLQTVQRSSLNLKLHQKAPFSAHHQICQVFMDHCTTHWFALLILHCNTAFWLTESTNLVFTQCKIKWFCTLLSSFENGQFYAENASRQNCSNNLNLEI